MNKFDIQTLEFSGSLLKRGFWLYIWYIHDGKRSVLYVGRTGDSSSRYASSPFNRMGQHLDLREKAPANMLKRNLEKEGFDLPSCNYKLIAIGPIFEEQSNLDGHRVLRDKIAPLETALAKHLTEKGYRVIGNHGSKREFDDSIFKMIIQSLEGKLPLATTNNDLPNPHE